MSQRVAHRYRIVAPLAKGGLGVIFKAFDDVTAQEVAFKRLRLDAIPERHRARAAVAFEREFFTLAQLAHPRVIQVHDYGVDETGPYYTMELLDGVDLRERAPLDWRQACVVLRDVSSSLALLHSRHLLHHDLSPRNVRCTSDGHAKLIDFGAMAPFGPATQLVGTPSYMAPEMVFGQTLDGRADLFGLGALAYFALSRQHAFAPTATLDLADTWLKPPTPLRQLVPSLPVALEHLIASLLSLDPMARPSCAAEVAGRLAAIADLPAEDLRASDAYLASPAFTARDEPLAAWKEHLERTLEARGRALLLLGGSGMGRTRFLSVAALEAKLAGMVALRVDGAEHSAAPYASMQALVADLTRQRPDLVVGPTDAGSLLRATQRASLAIFIDDFEQCDAASAALLAELALSAETGSLLITLAVRKEPSEKLPEFVQPIAERCSAIELQPLSLAATMELLRSVFGDVAGLATMAEWVQRLARGNPSMAMDLAQHLVENGVARMQDGVWLLPESLRTTDLPESVEQAIDARIATLTPAALRIAQALALVTAFAPLTVPEIVALVRDRHDPGEIYAALDALVGAQILVSAAETYRFKDRAVGNAVHALLDPQVEQALHSRIADAYLQRADVELTFLAAHHFLRGGAPARAYSVMLQTRAPTELSGLRSLFSRSRQGIALHEAMVRYAEQIEAPPRRIYRRRRTLIELAPAADPSLVRYAPPALEQLRLDTGLALLSAEEHAMLAPPQRGELALKRALAAWEATDDARRGLHPLRALHELGMMVIALCGVYARSWDTAQLSALPALLEPFVAVPGIAAVHKLVKLAIESLVGGHRVADQRRQFIAELSTTMDGVDTVMQQSACAAVTYYLGLDTALTSNPEALKHADFVEQFPPYSALSWHVRSLYHACSGDLQAMQDCERRMELFALRDVDSEQFLQVGLVYSMLIALRTEDLLTLQRHLPRVDEEAERFAGWVPWRHCFRGGYHWLRGDLAAARAELEAGLAGVRPGEHAAWHHLMGTLLHVLVELGEHAHAWRMAYDAVQAAQAFGLRPLEPTGFPIALTLAEAHGGHAEQAAVRIDDMLESLAQRTRGRRAAQGQPDLGIGTLHEARARLALMLFDRAGFALHAELAATHYRKLKRPGLLARHARLLQSARERFDALELRAAAAAASSMVPESNDRATVRTDRKSPR